jgi:hypothetical protein
VFTSGVVRAPGIARGVTLACALTRDFAVSRADAGTLERALQRLLVLVDQLRLGLAPFGDEPAFC